MQSIGIHHFLFFLNENIGWSNKVNIASNFDQRKKKHIEKSIGGNFHRKILIT